MGSLKDLKYGHCISEKMSVETFASYLFRDRVLRVGSIAEASIDKTEIDP